MVQNQRLQDNVITSRIINTQRENRAEIVNHSFTKPRDGVCYNNVEFFKDFIEKCGLCYNPFIQVSPKLVLPIAKAVEMLCYVLRPIHPFQPFVTPLEIGKVVTSHYFSIEKAKADLKYPSISIQFRFNFG
jgi:hypothetical protein